MSGLRNAAAVIGFLLSTASAQAAELQVSPAMIQLDRPEASQQILVTEVDGDRRRRKFFLCL